MTSLAEQEQGQKVRYALRDVGRAVADKVRYLQRHYVDEQSRDHAKARAWLAKLRRGVGKDPGAEPELWPMTLDGIPLPAGIDDDLTSQEYAAHAALTLYATHQQSRSRRMHQEGEGLGGAVRHLSRRAPSEEAVLRRFHALGTAVEFSEIVHHARGLIGQLRAYEIPLDYGRFADDLVWLQHPERAGGVRRAWGRDFHRVKPDGDTEADPDQNNNKTSARTSADETVQDENDTAAEAATKHEESL